MQNKRGVNEDFTDRKHFESIERCGKYWKSAWEQDSYDACTRHHCCKSFICIYRGIELFDNLNRILSVYNTSAYSRD